MKVSDKNSYLPTTVGSKSTITARGTCFPAPVSLKNVLKESSPPPIVLSLGIWPSGWIPCSKQYNSQQAFPIWTPAWPTCTEIHSRFNQCRNIKAEKVCFSISVFTATDWHLYCKNIIHKGRVFLNLCYLKSINWIVSIFILYRKPQSSLLNFKNATLLKIAPFYTKV